MADSPVLLAIDFGGTKTAVAVCDLTGALLASATVPAHAGTPGPSCQGAAAGAVFGRGVQAARDLLAAQAPGSWVAAVGAVTFGIPFEDRVELAPAIGGWEGLAFGRELRAAFRGVPVRMATDVKAAAAAEARWGALRGSDPGVYLNLGTGLAAALVVGGRVVHGRDGAAGEIGYNLRSVSDVGLPPGQRVPLEDVASGAGLARQAGGLGHGGAPGPGSPPPLTAAGVFAGAPRDAALAAVLSDTIDELAFHLVNLAITLNPARIAVGGGLVRSWDRLQQPLERALAAGVPFPPELVLARFPHDAPLRGAAALAADAAAAIPTRPGTSAQPNSLTEGQPQ